MHTHRTGGMTAIGVLNIVFGAIGSLKFLLATVLGGLVAVGGAAIESNAAANGAEGFGTAVATGGLFVILQGLIGLAAWLMLVVSGIGVLKLAPWGRTLAMVCGVVGGLHTGWSIVASRFEFNLLSYGVFLFFVLLVGLFMQPAWKAAFTGGATETDVDAASDEFRRAA